MPGDAKSQKDDEGKTMDDILRDEQSQNLGPDVALEGNIRKTGEKAVGIPGDNVGSGGAFEL